MTSNRKAIATLLGIIEQMKGPHPSGNAEATLAAWEIACEIYTDDQISNATGMLLRKKIFGKWPEAADLAECIEGRIIKVPEYATDLGGARYRERHGGPLCVERWHEVHVPFDWDGDPGDFNWADMPREMKDYHYAQIEGQKALGGGQ